MNFYLIQSCVGKSTPTASSHSTSSAKVEIRKAKRSKIMSEAVPPARIPTDAINSANDNVNVAATGIANDAMDENNDQQAENFDRQEAEVHPENLVGGHDVILLNQEEPMIDDVIIVAPALKVASIFRKEETRCDSDEVIAAGCAAFAVPEGWIRLEWNDLITSSNSQANLIPSYRFKTP